MENSAAINKKLDRISDLPNSLLLHILSFLRPKEAVATSLLSKRWRPLWLSLPTLYLNHEHFRSLTFFQKFVDELLKLVDLKSVKKFVLSFNCLIRDGHFRPRKMNKWINTVVSNKVEHLELQLYLYRYPEKDGYYELPSAVFTANNIKVLKLSGSGVSANTLSHVNLPLLEVLHLKNVPVGTLSFVNLPLLEVLHLKIPKFSEYRSLEMLISACPLLKDFTLEFRDRNFHPPLEFPRINHLVTATVPQSLIPLKALSNATFLHLNRPWYPEENYREKDMWPSSDDIPKFHNLTHLECVADEWTKMVNCLENFPKLQKLVINQLRSSSPPEPIRGVPLCLSLHLKEFTLCCYEGSKSQLEIIKFMMKNARVLRAVYICDGLVKYEIPRFQKSAACLMSSNTQELQWNA